MSDGTDLTVLFNASLKTCEFHKGVKRRIDDWRLEVRQPREVAEQCEFLRYVDKIIDSLCVELSKKCKLEEEQLLLSSSKHKFRTNKGNSDGGIHLLRACTNECNNALENFNGNKKFGIDLNVLDSAVIDNHNYELEMGIGEQDENFASNVKKKKYSCTRSNNAREIEDGTAIHSSSDNIINSREALLVVLFGACRQNTLGLFVCALWYF
eukprot:Gb_32181 [translate_table: standard]